MQCVTIRKEAVATLAMDSGCFVFNKHQADDLVLLEFAIPGGVHRSIMESLHVLHFKKLERQALCFGNIS